jgi:hypothetical protein
MEDRLRGRLGGRFETRARDPFVGTAGEAYREIYPAGLWSTVRAAAPHIPSAIYHLFEGVQFAIEVSAIALPVLNPRFEYSATTGRQQRPQPPQPC